MTRPVVELMCLIHRPSKLSVIPVTRSLVPIPDDIVETSDDDDDAADHLSASTHVSHQPRPFAVCHQLYKLSIN